ncbi:ABC transporter G family member 37 [Hevea brasiliensis]|uniref:ABC transporter G family member 37 n=1 Tax=Hevea brasiliensis TaxID=3981 RepID=UPI0025D01CF6|nr:ABC transporter G family member 37 [Hevea brasiliensis]
MIELLISTYSLPFTYILPLPLPLPLPLSIYIWLLQALLIEAIKIFLIKDQKMANTSSNSPPNNFMWLVRDDIELTSEAPSRRPSFCSEDISVTSESVITLPAGNITPMTPLTPTAMPTVFSGGASAEIRYEIEKASPERARNFALRMYESMKKHGLREEAEKAIGREEIKEEGGEVGRKSEELLGMEYLLKDGFVSYLRDMAKITPPIPQQVVRFSSIKYSRKFEISDNGYETFGNKVVGCFFGPLRTLLREKNSIWLQVLKGVDGYIMPGSMTLLLGPPGSGKSTLLEVLAGRVKMTKDLIMEGMVMYNDKNASEVRLSRLIAYISGQLNKHIPLLSVRETLEFARDCTQGLRPENFTPQMRKFFAHALVEGQDPFLEYILEILNLKEIQHKLTGDAISDTDRQRLTTAELALGTYSVMLYDQPFSGSDLPATYSLVDTIRTISRIQQSSAIMSLTQLSQDIFDLFDRIILLGDGHVLFQGPRQDAVPYFAKLGYTKPSHIESNEFLEDIAAGNGSQYMAPGATPCTLDELVECYRASDHYKDVTRIIDRDDVKHTYWVESEPGLGLSLKTPSKYQFSADTQLRRETELVVAKLSKKVGHSGGIESSGRVEVGDVVTAISMNKEEMQYLSVGPQKIQHQRASQVYSVLKQARGNIRLQVERYKNEEEEYHAQWEQFQRPFVQTWWKSTKTLINRQIKITKRLHALIKLRLFQAIVLGTFTGTLFYKLGGQYDQQKMNSVRALGFVSTMSIMLINLVQLPLYMLQRPIFYKHRAQRFFRGSSYIVAHCIVNLPQTLVEALAYTVCVYFLAGLSFSGNGAPLFAYMVLLCLVAYFGSSVFFLLSSVSSIPEVGNALAGLVVSIFLLFSGFVIYPSNIPIYWKWLMYVNPIHWANVSFCWFQFSKSYVDPCSIYLGQLPFCDQFPTMTVGKAYLKFYELSEYARRPWLPYVIILGWTVIANFLALLGLKNIEFAEMSQSLPYLRKTPMISNYREDAENESRSYNSYSENLGHSDASRFSSSKNSWMDYGKMKQNGGMERWVEEFHVDLERNGLDIPLQPVTLLFENVSFTRYNEETKENVAVFSNITGYAKPQHMVAILGGTRTSKATLLKCLAGRAPSMANLSGNIQVNGSRTGAAFSRLIGYVEKLDAHQPYLSIRESLQFSAALRLGQAVNTLGCRIHVELVLNQLGLLPYSNQLVGSLRDATGKTFEIAKKITIAVELAANPSILFLEEPLSGLDAAGTLNILNILSRLSKSGRIIIASLTHPNTRTLSSFDLALILTHKGHQAYFGPVGGNCTVLLEYFKSIPKAPHYSKRQSPVSYVMGTLGLGIQKRETPSLNYAEIYAASSLQEANYNEVCNVRKMMKGKTARDLTSTYPAPYSWQALLVLQRTQRFLWRNVQYTYGRLTGCIMIGLLMGSLYYQIEYKDIYGVTSRTLYIYMQVILIGVISANNIIPQIGTDRLVYFREKRAGMYLPIFYPVSWAVGEIPYFFIATLAVVGIGNGMAGIGTGSIAEFLKYWLVLFIFTLCVTYFGMMITFLAPLPTLAAFAVSIVTSMWVSASGVVVVLSDIRFYRWMYWSNPFQFALNVMTSISFYCNTKECASNCSCPKLPDDSYVWDRVASIRSLNQERGNTDTLILSAMCLLFASLAFIFFIVLKHNSPPQS